MGKIGKLAWALAACAVLGLIVWTGAGPVFGAVAAAGWGVLVVVALRGVALSGAGLGWYFLFPRGWRPSVMTCVLIRFLREGGGAL
ncbi:MAG: TIGR00374 family protein, partial [Hyphomicrobiales bacterium]|nr:TIGR00374 family protein [Hyphomicrobiales bacterium]